MAGLYYEQFEPGHVFRHAVTRTVTEMDNLLITTLSMNTQPLHLDAKEVRFPKPVFAGDTIHVETTAKSKRLSKSRSDSGIVDFEHRGYNQRDEVVCICERAALMKVQP
jgi:acyl dehydratase